MSVWRITKQISLLTLKAGKKTAGIVGDDLALNSKALLGMPPERELPVVWAVAKKSLANKAIIIPAALAFSAAAPWAIVPLMTAGGAFLCYEGAEKLLHKYLHKEKHAAAETEETEDDKIRKAAQTDLILSAEIIVVSLGAVANNPLLTQAGALTAIGVAMTGGVYGAVAALVKMDDWGRSLSHQDGKLLGFVPKKQFGRALVKSAPAILKTIGFLGSVAMFTVGGEIVVHGLPGLHPWLHGVAHSIGGTGFAGSGVEMALSGLAGLATGFLAIPALKALNGPWSRFKNFIDDKLGRKKQRELDAFIAGYEPVLAPGLEPVPAKSSGLPPPDIRVHLNTAAAGPSDKAPKPMPPRAPLPDLPSVSP